MLPVELGSFFELGEGGRRNKRCGMRAEIAIDCREETVALNQGIESRPIYGWATAGLQTLDLNILQGTRSACQQQAKFSGKFKCGGQYL